MTKNILSDIEVLLVEIIDTGHRKVSGDIDVPYKDETKAVFSKLLSYVRGGGWTDNDTAKFVAQNFMLGQGNLADAWKQRFPSKPEKADSTMRTQWQKVNRYLEHVLPSNLIDIFVTENMEGLEKLSVTIDSLRFNDKRIESELGEQLVYELQDLPLSSKKYSVEDCLHEIEVLKRLSTVTYRAIMDTCDKSKMAYAFYVLTRPSNIKGEINESRLEFVKAFTEVGTAVNGDLNSSEVFDAENSQGYHGFNAIREYINGVYVSDDTVVNPEILYFLHDYTTHDGILNGISQFNREEVAYVMSEIENGNDMFIDAIKNGRPTPENSLKDEYSLVSGCQEKIESIVEGVSPSSNLSPLAVQVVTDYMKSKMYERLNSLKPEELAKVYKDMLSDEDTSTDKMIHLFNKEGVSEYEAERLKLKREYMSV